MLLLWIDLVVWCVERAQSAYMRATFYNDHGHRPCTIPHRGKKKHLSSITIIQYRLHVVVSVARFLFAYFDFFVRRCSSQQNITNSCTQVKCRTIQQHDA